MIEVSAIVLILLAEGFVLALLAVAVLIVLIMRARSRRRKAIEQLADQLRKQSEVRRAETGSFLQQIYELEDAELKKAVNEIDKQEKLFFQKIIEIFYNDNMTLVPTLDAALAQLIDTYKSLKPKERVQEVAPDNTVEIEELKTANEDLKKSNAQLTEELAITKKTMDSMISEFGNMFAGGSNNDLAKTDVVGQLDSKDDVVEAAKAKATAAKAVDSKDDDSELLKSLE